MADPFLKFYTSDWRSDPRLRMCSAGARGAWIEMICLMHEATPYGHLLIHGQTPNEAQLASLTGIPAAELGDYLAELERLAVFSRTKEGVIYSRKLVRMASRSAIARKKGKMGGNPSLSKEGKKTRQLKPEVIPPDKPQKPEARSQREKEEPEGSSKKRGSRLDLDWSLPDEWAEWARAEAGLDDLFIRRESQRFKDYWIGKAGSTAVKLDWFATWRNWTRRAAEGRQGTMPHSPAKTEQEQLDRWASY